MRTSMRYMLVGNVDIINKYILKKRIEKGLKKLNNR